MTYRKIDTCIWQDVWFENLQSTGKLAFIYFWSNDYCTQSGIYGMTPKRFHFDTGLDFEESIQQLSGKVEWNQNEGLIWVKNFFKHQCQNVFFVKAALGSLSQHNGIKKRFYEYNKIIISGYTGIELGKYGLP